MPDWGVWLLVAIAGWVISSAWVAFALGAMSGRVSERGTSATIPAVGDSSAADRGPHLHLVRGR